MLRSSENETEILLGNKQLLGIFFVVAILLGIAFTGGYMVGRAGAGKKTSETPSSTVGDSSGTASGQPGETHSVPAEGGQDTPNEGATTHTATAGQEPEAPPLGSAKRKNTAKPGASEPQSAVAGERSIANFTPQTGQQFLQVVAVSRDEAAAIADVLHKKGFPAHAVPKPNNPKVFRVLIGPIRDAADLASTREALHKTGFREVIVQRY